MSSLFSFAGKFLSGPVGILIIAFFIINGKDGTINDLKDSNQSLRDSLITIAVYNQALKDTIKGLGNITEGVPESIEVMVPYPVEVPVPESSDDCEKPFLNFCTEQDWAAFYRNRCTGIIEFNDTTVWENGLGCIAIGKFYYGTGSTKDNSLLLLPYGRMNTPKQKNSKFRMHINASLEFDKDFKYKGQTIDLGILIRNNLGASTGLDIKPNESIGFRFGVDYFFWYR